MKNKSFMISFLIIVFSGIFGYSAQPVAPTSMFSFFGPRAFSMMGAQTAVGNDVFGIIANPVGIEHLKIPEFGSAYLNWFGDTMFVFNGLVFPQKKEAYMSLGVMYFSATPLDEVLPDAGLSGDKVGISDYSVLVGYSVPIQGLFLLNSLLRIGGNAKLVYSHIVDSYANTIVFDAGLRYTIMTLNHSFMIAFALQNWGLSESFGNYKGVLSKKYKLGFGSELKFGRHLIVPDVDVIYNTFTGLAVNSGLEYSLLLKTYKIVSLRTGYQIYSKNENANFLSFGIGSEFHLKHFLMIDSVALDYSLSMLHDLGYRHSVSLKLQFSSVKEFIKEEKLKRKIQRQKIKKLRKNEKSKIMNQEENTLDQQIKTNDNISNTIMDAKTNTIQNKIKK